MRRLSLALLIALPPVAILLNHDIVSAVLIIAWTMLVIPVCILQAIDYLESDDSNHSNILKHILRAPVGLFGLISFVMGTAIVLWCLYNVFIHRMPEYTGPPDAVSLLFGGFGIGPALMAFGWWWMALAIKPFEKSRSKFEQAPPAEGTGLSDAEADAWMDQYALDASKIYALSHEEARLHAEALLKDPLRLECFPSSSPQLDILIKFAPGVQSLFSRYERIRVVDDEAYLSREDLTPLNRDGDGLSWGQDFWVIGQAHGHSVTLVKPQEEFIYDTVDDEVGEPCPSIYHWLLLACAAAAGFNFESAKWSPPL